MYSSLAMVLDTLLGDLDGMTVSFILRETGRRCGRSSGVVGEVQALWEKSRRWRRPGAGEALRSAPAAGLTRFFSYFFREWQKYYPVYFTKL